MNIPALHIQGHGEPVHFYHANGFPAEVYTPLLEQLASQFDVFAMHGRATWENIGEPSHDNWQIYADDLIAYLEQSQTQPIIAIGHSMGASSTVLAAIKRPDLFKALVLIEPAMVNWPIRLLLNLTPHKVIRGSKLVSGTANKPDTWSDRDTYEAYLKKFRGYRLFNDAAFEAFKHHGVKDTDIGEVTLRFPKHWEAYNYTNPPYLMKYLKKLNHKKWSIPTLAIRGEPNGFFSDKLWQTWQNHQPDALYVQDKKYGHLMPLEGPEETAKLIVNGLKHLHVI
ncbi:MAG: alpha/beta hydrolase [Gammaproteobacteria bacterium]|nr:alpha/beta hydrolase [Gammaproteobacteria bacterium]